MAKKKIIELKNVCKDYGSLNVVDDFNLYVNKGEFVTFLGPSGCGKTTTLRMIAGFEMPSSGEILLNGNDISHLPPHKRPVNTVFQRYALFPNLDVYDNIAFGLKLKKIPLENGKFRKLTSQEIDDKVTSALKLVDLEEFEGRDISTLSGGQQQRIAIARAIVNEPEILLLDEPLGALDLKMRKDMQLELKEMHRKLGITFIYVTHDQEEALTMSDTIVVMKDGIIQQIGTPTDIYNEPKNAFVANFIGESNIYTGTIIADDKVKFVNHIFECVDVFEKNEKVDIVVRPEDVKVVNVEDGQVKGKLISKVFKGIHYEYVMMVGKNEVVIQTTEDYKLNSVYGIIIDPDSIHIMKKEVLSNIYDEAYITKKNMVNIAGADFECDLTQLYPNSQIDEEGYLVEENGTKHDMTDVDVIAEVGLKDITITDNIDECELVGNIISIIYKGDHYQLIVRTESTDDFIFDTEDTWNENDQVGIIIPSDKIKLKLKGEKVHD